MHNRVFRACAIALRAGSAIAGCDKLTAALGKKRADPDSARAPSHAAVQPAKPVVLPTETLAIVNGVPIAKADLELRIQELKALAMNLGQPWTPLAKEQLQAGVDELVTSELLNQAAITRGLDRDAETQQRWAFARRAFFAQEWLRWNRQRLEVKSDEVEKFYEENKQGFREPERRRLRQLVVAGEDDAKRALAQLLGGSVSFDALAKQISAAASAANGGLLDDWVMRANEKALAFPSDAEASAAGIISLDPALEAAAFVIDKVDGLSNYVKGPDGKYHLFQLVERKAERQRPLTELWDQIKNFLLVQKLQGAIDELRKSAKIEKFPERLESVKQ